MCPITDEDCYRDGNCDMCPVAKNYVPISDGNKNKKSIHGLKN